MKRIARAFECGAIAGFKKRDIPFLCEEEPLHFVCVERFSLFLRLAF